MGIIPILWAGDILVKSKNALKTLKPRINLKKGEGALGNYSERVPNSNIFALFSPSCANILVIFTETMICFLIYPNISI